MVPPLDFRVIGSGCQINPSSLGLTILIPSPPALPHPVPKNIAMSGSIPMLMRTLI